ncbi:hypothetical protein Tco_0070933 [Tanacetum coccineum]
MVDYWTMIAFDGDFLGPPPSYTSIKELLRKLCHHLITFTNFDKGQSPEKVTTTDIFFLRSMAEGTVSLQNLTIEVRDLPTIDPEELIKLRICGGAKIDPEVPQDSLVGQKDAQPGHAHQHAP